MVGPYIYPPLGLLTRVREPVIPFRVHFVRSSAETASVTDVEIWSDMAGDGEWQGTPLLASDVSSATELAFLDVAQLGEHHRIEQFHLDLPTSAVVARHFEFTMRWHSSDSRGKWQWASSFGQNACVTKCPPRLTDSGKPPASYWRQQLRSLLRPACPDDSGQQPPAMAIADSWQVSPAGASCMFRPSESAAPAPVASSAAYFGQLDDIDAMLAFARKDPFWIVPRSGADGSVAAGLDAVLVLVELSSGAYAALMPFSKDSPTKHTVTFRTGPHNTLCLQASPALDSPAALSIRVAAKSDIWLIPKAEIAAFYDEFYQWLHTQGITFVKVDYQAAFETLSDSGADIYATYSAYYAAMESAALKYFGPGSVVYCMAQTPHLILRSLQHLGSLAETKGGAILPQQRDVLRNSDDYFPENPRSHGWHIYCNMANSLWSRHLQLRYAIDWDMFQPGKQESHIHAISRALSGGPIYITGASTDYAKQNLASTVGCTGHLPLPLPPLISGDCLFTDMTSTPGILVGSTSLSDGAAVIISVYNVFHKMVVASAW
ncbi:hypothetical protein GGI20_001751 [Coemansia sp. BCRC 34301]|nr:hypothetical protein GGI20_001751 [Coemansia sp. BCRC 34301]